MWREYFQRNYECGCGCFSCLSKWLTGYMVKPALSSWWQNPKYFNGKISKLGQWLYHCMNFISIGSRVPKNQICLFLLLKSEFFGQNVNMWSSVVTMAMIYLPVQIWLFLFIPPAKLPPHKNLKLFISNFASLSLIEADHMGDWSPEKDCC